MNTAPAQTLGVYERIEGERIAVCDNLPAESGYTFGRMGQ
jgi:hypothetical protein